MRWRFTLTDTTFGTTITQVVDEPQGWNSSKFIFRRDLKWHGIFFDYTLGDLVFYGAGYTILEDAFGEKGISATTTLLIEVECAPNTGYDEFFEGKVNYAKRKLIRSDICGVSIGIEQTGCLQQFITRYDQKVNLETLTSFDGTSLSPYAGLGFQQELPVKDIIFQSDLSNPQTLTFTPLDPPATSVAHQFFGMPQWDVNMQDIENTYGILITAWNLQSLMNTVDFRRDNDGVITFAANNIVCAGDVSISLDLDGTLTEVSADARQYNGFLNFIHAGADGNYKTIVNLDIGWGGVFGGSVTNTHNFTASHSANYTLEQGDKLFLYFQLGDYIYTTGGGGVSDPFDLNITFTSGSFTASLRSLCPTTSDAKAFLINEALSRVTEAITDDCMRVYSEWYGRTDSEPYDALEDGCGSNKLITNGLLIRNAELNDGSDPIMSVSFKDLFDGLNPIDNIGIGIEDDPQRAAGFKRIRVEDVAFFYNTALVAQCADVKEIEIKVDDKRVYSNILVGYKKWQPDDYGGRDDFHSKREYRTEQQEVANTLDIQSTFIASNYSAELTRRIGASSEDWKYDNDTFIYTWARNVYGNYDIDDDFFPNSGANNMALFYFNQRITPIRNLLHWFKTIASTWSYEFLTQLIKLRFTSGEANYLSQWRKDANDDCLLENQTPLLAENQDIGKTDFKDYDDCKPLWHPETIEFDYPLSYTQFRSIRNNPYRLVQVTQGANTWYGWIENLEYDVNEGMGSWKLIRQYENNY